MVLVYLFRIKGRVIAFFGETFYVVDLFIERSVGLCFIDFFRVYEWCYFVFAFF